MLHYIYTRSFIGTITFMALALAAWGALPARVGARRWRCGNLVLVLLITAAILYATLFSRAEGDPHPLRLPDRCAAAAGALPRDADERLPLLPAGADAFQRPAAKVAPLGQNHPHNAHRLCAQRGN